jgi:hypothetical protein
LLLLLPACSSDPVKKDSASLMGSVTHTPRPHRVTRKEKVEKLLVGEKMPTERQLRRLGDGVESDLVDIINNRRAEHYVRLRAVYCMGYFQNRRARTMLRSVLTDPNWDKPFRLAALEAMARCVGAELFETAKDYALDPDSDMRLAAIRSLVVIGTPNVLPLLKTLQMRETDPNVLDAIDDAIHKLGRSPLERR